MTHKELQLKAIDWLYKRGCSVFADEVPTTNGIADAAGIITDSLHNPQTSYYIEVKVSRSDLICAKQKIIYNRSFCLNESKYGNPGIDFYYLMVPNYLKVEDTLYPSWGVINEDLKVIRKAKRYKFDDGRNRQKLLQGIAHTLVYRVYGKLYLNQSIKSLSYASKNRYKILK